MEKSDNTVHTKQKRKLSSSKPSQKLSTSLADINSPVEAPFLIRTLIWDRLKTYINDVEVEEIKSFLGEPTIEQNKVKSLSKWA